MKNIRHKPENSFGLLRCALNIQRFKNSINITIINAPEKILKPLILKWQQTNEKKLNAKIEIIIFMNLLSFIQYTETLARRLVINTPQHHSTHKPSLIFPHFQLISLPSPSFSSSLLFLKNPRFHFFLPLRGLFEPEERESQRLFLTQFFF